ncbi:hypothetical protein PSP6_340002 [Paraburkholderia tropica]|nr:hypothetical protein PSP6_340002 [Paraburkholderia tropica]
MDARMMFIPQQSYLPIGTLKAALTYPAHADAYSDEECREALRARAAAQARLSVPRRSDQRARSRQRKPSLQAVHGASAEGGDRERRASRIALDVSRRDARNRALA